MFHASKGKSKLFLISNLIILSTATIVSAAEMSFSGSIGTWTIPTNSGSATNDGEFKNDPTAGLGFASSLGLDGVWGLTLGLHFYEGGANQAEVGISADLGDSGTLKLGYQDAHNEDNTAFGEDGWLVGYENDFDAFGSDAVNFGLSFYYYGDNSDGFVEDYIEVSLGFGGFGVSYNVSEYTDTNDVEHDADTFKLFYGYEVNDSLKVTPAISVAEKIDNGSSNSSHETLYTIQFEYDLFGETDKSSTTTKTREGLDVHGYGVPVGF